MNSLIPRAVARARFRCATGVLGAACAFTFAGGCAVPMQQREAPTRAESTLAVVQMRAILQDHWEYAQASWPEHRTWAGQRALDLTDFSLGAAKGRASFARATLRALDRVRFEALPEDWYISWLTLQWDAATLQRIPTYFYNDLTFITPSASPLRTSLDVLQQQPLADTSDAQWYLRLLVQYAALADSVRAGLEHRAARGVVLPRLVVPRATRFVRALVAAKDASPFAPAAERFTIADTVSALRLRSAIGDSITLRINPALERLAAFLEGEYATRASEKIGVWQYAGGQAYYRSLVGSYSTLDITPEEAHAIGLREVAWLDSLAAVARAGLGLPGDRDSLRARLASDSAMTVRSSANVLDHILAAYGTIALQLGRVFSRSPESSADVQVMGPSLEDIAPLTLYSPPSVRDPKGHYRFNAHRWAQRSLVTLHARVYQDLLPGGHLRAAIQRENAELPAFRRVAHHAGLVDGWGVYAVEMADSIRARADNAHWGALLQRLSIACGLVVDTGINYFGWTREQALAFLRQHLLDDDAELERELIIPAVEEPASLVSGALGSRELRGLRRWAQQELGARFDLRAFHDEILAVGSVPLPVLGTHFEWWLWRERTRAAADTSGRPPR